MAAGNNILLQLRDWSLTRRGPAGEKTILRDINLEIRAGRWLAVLGANGSGKSSLLKYLASDDSPLTPRRAIMFQDPDEQIVAGTVERELTLGRAPREAPGLMKEFGLEGLAGLDPRLLSAGQKQRLVLAVVLAGDPEVLFCDEPTALQDEAQTVWLLEHLDSWRRRTGATLVTATCDRREAQRADDLLVLEEGRVVCCGPSGDLLSNPAVAALLDPEVRRENRTSSTRGGPFRGGPGGPPVLSLQGMGCRFDGPGGGFAPVDLEVRPGERIGIIGPNGCGKSTLLAACVGARKPDQGMALLAGKPLYKGKSRDLDHGMALLAPQFPEYIFTRTTVAEEIALDPALTGLEVAGLLAGMGLPPEIGPQNPHALSSGQKRRLALALVLFSRRPLLLLDEPTAALDRQGRQLMAELVDRVPGETALVVASHDRFFLEQIGCECLELGPLTGLGNSGQ